MASEFGEACRELHLSRAAEVVGVGRKHHLTGGEDGSVGGAKQADGLGAEVAVAGASQVEDVEKEIKVPTFPAQPTKA